jgi:Uma2 family endonuclease
MSTTVKNPPQRHRLSVRDYYRMAEAGILRPDERVELIEGEIIDMVPAGSRHAGTVNQLTSLLQKAVGEAAIVHVQNPLSLGEYSQPEPDLAVLRFRADFYKTAHPVPADVLLVIEAADTSLSHDRDVKVPLYARHGVPEVWLLDLDRRRLTRYREPGEEAYLTVDTPDLQGLRIGEIGSVADLAEVFGD